MANPPFNIDATIPQDTGIVSQYPLQERTMRDNAKSWLLVDHNTSGQHTHVTFAQAAAPASPGANLTWMYGTTDGTIHISSGAAGTDEVFGVPPGAVLPYAGSALINGFLWCNGAAVSRTTYSRLFGIIASSYGAGDGSTTFNVPDMRQKLPAGVDGTQMGGVANTGLLSNVGAGFGVNGGQQSVGIAQANLPNVNFLVTGTTNTVLTGAASVTSALNIAGGAGSTTVAQPSGATALSDPGHFHTVSGTAASGGSGTALQIVPPVLLFGWIIKW